MWSVRLSCLFSFSFLFVLVCAGVAKLTHVTWLSCSLLLVLLFSSHLQQVSRFFFFLLVCFKRDMHSHYNKKVRDGDNGLRLLLLLMLLLALIMMPLMLCGALNALLSSPTLSPLPFFFYFMQLFVVTLVVLHEHTLAPSLFACALARFLSFFLLSFRDCRECSILHGKRYVSLVSCLLILSPRTWRLCSSFDFS